jgi:hypothetical protein
VGDIPVIGDWSGDDGVDELGVYRPSERIFYRYGRTPIAFGDPGDVPISGNRFGARGSEVGVYRPSNSTFYFRSQTGSNTTVIAFGNVGDRPVVGDWNGETEDEVGVYRDQVFYLRYSDTVTRVIPFGDPGDVPLIGDWDDDGYDNVGVYRPSNRTFYPGPDLH